VAAGRLTMQIDALDELEYAFAEWRRGKKHVRERMPEELVARARRATREHGVTAVVRVSGVERARLFRAARLRPKAPGVASTMPRLTGTSVPTFSRLDLSAPSASRFRPIAEVETGLGVTLRVFEQTAEMVGLLTAVCGLGGGR
jgi:hypothetical protein